MKKKVKWQRINFLRKKNKMLEYIYQNPLIFGIILLWNVPWKGVALWKAARNRQKIWFILLLIVNTMAILEIIYLFIFCEPKEDKNKDEKSEDTEDVSQEEIVD